MASHTFTGSVLVRTPLMNRVTTTSANNARGDQKRLEHGAPGTAKTAEPEGGQRPHRGGDDGGAEGHLKRAAERGHPFWAREEAPVLAQPGVAGDQLEDHGGAERHGDD